MELEDGMKIQITSLDGHDWSDFRKILIQAAREAQRATPETDYATVLAVIKSNKWPENPRERHCLKQWQSQMARRIQVLKEATSKARNSEVPRAATTQPQEPQTARRQVHEEETADATTTNSERAEPVAPADSSRDPPDTPPEDGAWHRAGEGVEEVRTGAGGDDEVDHTQTTPEGTHEVTQSKPHGGTAHHVNANTPSASHTEPHRSSMNTAPRRDANVGAGDGMRAQRRGPRRRRRGAREGGGGDAEPRERPDAARSGARRGPGTHLHHPSMTTSASAQSASRGYPGEDAERTDPPRPSEDPADATGNGERRPDAPTEPPNKPEGMRGRRSQERVETRASRASREVEAGPGKDGDEERRPGEPDGPSDEPEVMSRDPTSVKVEPGGEIEARRSRVVAHDSPGVLMAEEAPQDEVERSTTRRDMSIEGEKGNATQRAHARSTKGVEENCQRTSTDGDDIPGTPPDPHPPLTSLPRPPDEPPSVELEGERRNIASCKDELTGDDRDASGPSEDDEDARGRPKKLVNTSDRISKRSKRRARKDSPGKAQVEPDDPGDEADASAASEGVEDHGNVWKNLRETSERVGERPERRTRANSLKKARDRLYDPGGEAIDADDLHLYQGGPTDRGNQRGGDTSAQCRARGSGGDGGDQVKSRGTEVDWGRRNVGKGAEHDRVRTRTDGNERVVETNAQRRVNRPGGHSSEGTESGVVKGDRKRRNDGIGVVCDGNRCSEDGATSSARRESKRLKTKMLAGDKNVSKNGISARWQTYLGHPYHLLVIPGEPPTTRTCRVVKKRRKRDLEMSVQGDGPTRPYGRVEAASGGSDTSYMLYTD